MQAGLIWRYSIDIPYADEWELFKSGSFLIHPSWTSLWAQHNEHRLVIPKLVFSVYYHALSFYIPLASIINFGFFTLAFGLMCKFSFVQNKKVFFALFALMAFSPLNFENHLWVFQIQWHLFLCFLILSCYWLTRDRITNGSLIWFLVLPLAMIFSLGSGLAAGLTFIVLIALKMIFISEKPLNKKGGVLFLLATITGIAAYFTGYVKPTYHPVLLLPYKKEFWEHFGAITSLGLGNREHRFKILVVFFLFAHIRIGYDVVRNWSGSTQRHRFLFLLATTLLAVLASISISRAGFGSDQGFSSRYYEYSSFYLIAVLSLSIEKLSLLKARYTLIIFAILIYSTLSNYTTREYAAMLNQRETGLACLKENVTKKKNEICTSIYPFAPVIDTILELKKGNYNLSFLKNFE